MVKRIDIEKKLELDSDAFLGYFAEDKDYDTLVDYDADVYLDGEKIIAFRKGRFKEFVNPSKKTWDFWKRAGKSQFNDARGKAAGAYLSDRWEHRVTAGQLNFLKRAMKQEFTEAEAREIIDSGKDPSNFLYKWTWTKKDRLVETDRIEQIIAQMRKKEFKQGTPAGDKLWEERVKLELEWFENWFNRVYLPSSDKISSAKEAFSRYVETQSRGNRCYSNVLGAFDRTPRIPYARLSKFTEDNFEEYASEENSRTYKYASETLRETLPEVFNRMNSHFSYVHPEFNLFGTCFTTITVNYQYRTAYHHDGNNFQNGVGVLTALTRGKYSGHYLVFPEVRLAFDLKDGDFIAGDTQSMIHGNTAMVKETEDAQRISLVFYGRENLAFVDSIECEKCRRDFVNHAKENHKERCTTGRVKSWTGIFPGMWESPEWIAYKSKHCPDAKNTNYRGTTSKDD